MQMQTWPRCVCPCSWPDWPTLLCPHQSPFFSILWPLKISQLPEKLRAQPSLFIRETQTKSTMRYHFTPMRMAIIERCTSVGEDVEKLEPLCSIGRNWKMVQSLRKTVWRCPKKLNLGTSLVVQWLRIGLPMQGTWVQSMAQKIPHASAQCNKE